MTVITHYKVLCTTMTFPHVFLNYWCVCIWNIFVAHFW